MTLKVFSKLNTMGEAHVVDSKRTALHGHGLCRSQRRVRVTQVGKPMQRRKFLIGFGALTAGSAAAIGTGAFTGIVAERNVDIDVRGDANAFLQIEAEDSPNAGAYVVTDGNGVVGLNFDSVNRDADSKFANLLRIQNEGTQEVRVGVDHDDSDLPSGFGVFAEGPTGDGSLTPKPEVHNNTGSGAGDTGGGFDFDDDPVHLEAGEAVENIGVAWDRGNVDFDELDGSHSLVIKAEVLDDGQPGDRT